MKLETALGYPQATPRSPGIISGYPNRISGISLGIAYKMLGFIRGYPRANHNILGSRFS